MDEIIEGRNSKIWLWIMEYSEWSAHACEINFVPPPYQPHYPIPIPAFASINQWDEQHVLNFAQMASEGVVALRPYC